jgi:hypothetical protein
MKQKREGTKAPSQLSRFAFEQTYRLMSKDKYFIGNPIFSQILNFYHSKEN